MADFFYNLINKISGLFSKTDLNGSITGFQSRIDVIINDLLRPYAEPTELGVNDKFRNLIRLIDPKQCNKIALTLSSNLEKNYTKIQLEQFASSILIGEEATDCNDDNCSEDNKQSINNKNGKVSKKIICKSIATHYVKILNLISAILSAVNPTDNMCLNRLNNLLKIIDNDTKIGVSSICNNDGNDGNGGNGGNGKGNNTVNNAGDTDINVVKKNIMLEPGIKQLLMLYYYHMMQDTETEDEIKNVLNQYNFLVESFSKLTMKYDPELSYNNAKMNIYNNNNNNVNPQQHNNDNINLQRNNNVNPQQYNNNNINLQRNNVNPQQNNKNKNINLQNINNKRYATQNNINKLRNNMNEYKQEEKSTLNIISKNLSNLKNSVNAIKDTSKQTPNTNINNATIEQQKPNTNIVSHTITTPFSMQKNTSNINKTNINTNTNTTTNINKSSISSANVIPNAPEPIINEDADIEDIEEDDEDDEDDDNEDDDDEEKEESEEEADITTQSPPQSMMQSPSLSTPLTSSLTSPSTSSLTTQLTQANTTPSPSQSMTTQLTQTNTQEPMTQQPQQFGGSTYSKVSTIKNEKNHKSNKRNNSTSNSNSNNNRQGTLIDKFMSFVDAYNTIDKIDDRVISVINTAFKNYDNYDSLNKDEADYYISSKNFNEFCINNINTNNNNLITLNIDDTRLTEFIKIYTDLKKLYIDNCEALLVLLENKILVKDPINDKDTNLHFTLKNIGYSELVEFETDVRNRLVAMYTQCHEHYQRGIVALYKALSEPIQA